MLLIIYVQRFDLKLNNKSLMTDAINAFAVVLQYYIIPSMFNGTLMNGCGHNIFYTQAQCYTQKL